MCTFQKCHTHGHHEWTCQWTFERATLRTEAISVAFLSRTHSHCFLPSPCSILIRRWPRRVDSLAGDEEETISKCRFQNVTRHDHYECTSYRVTFKWSLFCNTLQHTARHCSRLNHIPILQHTATHCNILQHIGPESSCKKQGLYRPGALFWFVGLAHLLWHK